FTNKSGLMQLLDMFSGGAFSQASIFALGIMPYITASIVIQLCGMILPSFQKMQREGESGRQKLNQYTRYLTVVILALQAPAYLINLQVQVNGASNSAHPMVFGFWTVVYLTIILASGSMFILWLGERITDRGIGNGISFIILVGIIARLPLALWYEFSSRMPGATGGQGGLVMFIVEIVLLFIVTVGAVLLVQGTRKVPVQYAKRVIGNRQYGGQRQYLPLKVNAAGVMPIIFAQAIMFIPMTLAGFRGGESGFMHAFTDINSFWYNFVFFLLIVAFTYFYTAITVRPVDMADQLKRNNGFIPGVKPGKKTAEYIEEIMSRITLPGSIFLGIVAILPAFARFFGISQNFAQFFGGTSLLIMVGVVLDTLQQVESHLKMHHYDGLMKEGNIKGRTTGSAY
ncbi:MAG: preprotein translocase subunit SecY, partial [Muribaculaceae bacterium]|nr:preprotein translocase subunit SecY [Muribaculaceae bacterium]